MRYQSARSTNEIRRFISLVGFWGKSKANLRLCFSFIWLVGWISFCVNTTKQNDEKSNKWVFFHHKLKPTCHDFDLMLYYRVIIQLNTLCLLYDFPFDTEEMGDK
jgi:hypothetical protein